MIPVHWFMSKNKHSLDDDWKMIVGTTEGIEKHQQIFTSYGSRCNDEFSLNYRCNPSTQSLRFVYVVWKP